MSASPAKRPTVAGKGPARGYSWPPFENGNRAAAKSGFYVKALAPSEQEEVQEIADAIRELSPLDGEAQEPLVQLTAAQFWRQRVAVRYIDEHGIDHVAKSSSLLRDLATLERSLLANLKALALTPQAAADLGLTWARTSALRFDPDRLTEGEQAQLDRLIEKVVSLRRRKLTVIAEQRQADDVDRVLEHGTECETLELFASAGVTLAVLVATRSRRLRWRHSTP